MNNRQAPESSPHPPQPTNRWLPSSPNVFTVHTLYSAVDTELMLLGGMSKNMGRDSVGVVCSQESTYEDVQELRWHILLHFLSLKHENVT